MDSSVITQRLYALRQELRREHLAAFIFPTGDPHNSEYTADHWKGREWISGFNGSAGTAVVTLTGAALWTDSRYFIAADRQLEGTEFHLMKEKVEGTPTIAEWLQSQISNLDTSSTEVGINGLTAPVSSIERLTAELRKAGGLTLRTNFDPLVRIWADRPDVPLEPVVIQPEELAGESVVSKMGRIRRALRAVHADGMLMSALDDIAWTLNLRGADVHCNPVFIAYLLVTSRTATLFVHQEKLSEEVCSYLTDCGVRTARYEMVREALVNYPDYTILMDPDETNAVLFHAVKCHDVIRRSSPVPMLKAVKTKAEQDGFRKAMVRDGVAMVRFLKELSEWSVASEDDFTEMTVDRRLTALRSEQPLFRGLSFDTIAGYEEHGAIVHYKATPETDIPLERHGLLLVDSGAHYQDGTTDITRTIALGPLTEEQRQVYTLVLKGHIDLLLLHFPAGASGTQLDAIARQPLWKAGLNYLHGTGHGVGSFLNVHEGPHQIRMEWRPAPLCAGMTVTDEPGVYLEGRFGVRIENMLLVVPDGETACGRFLKFETLTCCPIDKTPIIKELLSSEERQWLDEYHQKVYGQLSPYLDAEEKAWLRQTTAPL